MFVGAAEQSQANSIYYPSSVAKSEENDLHHLVPDNNHDPILEQIHMEESSAWNCFKACFQQQTPLAVELSLLSQNDNLDDILSEEDQVKIASAFSADEYMQVRGSLREIFKKIDVSNLRSIMEKVIEGCFEKDSFPLIRCLSLLTKGDMENIAVDIIGQDGWDAIKDDITHLALSEEGRFVPSVIETEIKYGIAAIPDYIHAFLDTILMAFSFFEIGQEPASSWEASHMLMVYGQLIGIPLLLLTTISAIIVSTTIAIVTTAAIVLLLIAALVIYVKYLKPCPEYNQIWTNLTADAKYGRIEPVVARDGIIDEVIAILASNVGNGTRIHPLLVGPSGAGKTEIMKGVALRIIRGDVPDCLKGVKVLKINTARMLNGAGHINIEDKFDRLSKRLGKYKDTSVIIFWDEIHAAFTPKYVATCGNRLKSFFDTSSESFRFNVGATTSKEHKKYVSIDEAFCRRTQNVNVPITDKDETLFILREQIELNAPHLDIPEETLEQIFTLTSEKLPNLAQPAISKRILSKAIAETNKKFEQAPSKEALNQIRQEYDIIRSTYRRQHLKSEGKALGLKMDELKAKMEELQENVDKEKLNLEKLQTFKRHRAQKKEASLKLALHIYQNQEEGLDTDEDLKKFVALQHVVLPYLDKQIKELSDVLGVATEMELELIEELVNEEVKAAVDQPDNEKQLENGDSDDKIVQEMGVDDLEE